MKFNDFVKENFTIRVSAMELLGLYSALIGREDFLDDNQRRVLESVRQELYQKFSIEEFEVLESAYQDKIRG